MSQPQTEFVDFYRASLKHAVAMVMSSLDSAERLQNQQVAGIRRALEQYAKSVNDLTEAKGLDELLALQQKMAGAQFERAIGYWSSLCQAVGESQMAAIGQAQAQMAQARDWFNESYALTIRATEARLATAQAPIANASVRSGAAKQERKTA